jgi:hypothetical protein
MNISYSKQLFKIALLAILTVYCLNTQGQARSSISFGAGPAFPIGSGYEVGSTWALQVNVKINSKFAVGTMLGIENVVSEKKGRYNGYYFEGSPREASLLMLSLPGRYYITESLFATLAPTLYVGGESASSSGLGGTAGAGYDLTLDARNTIELMLHCDRLMVYTDHVTVVGLRMAYKFNFRKK